MTTKAKAMARTKMMTSEPMPIVLSTRAIAIAPMRMTMSPPPSEAPVMPPPRAVAMRTQVRTIDRARGWQASQPRDQRAPATSVPTPSNGPLRMTMSIDRRWSS